MILYPTETLYALGVNALDWEELSKLYTLKGRPEGKSVSWLVRDVADIKWYAEFGKVAAKIAERFLPGPLTLVLPVKNEVVTKYPFLGKTVGFRISSDPITQKLISDFMAKHDAPLTCTSANISGMPTESTVEAIRAQLGEKASMIDTVVDDGPRIGTPTTVVEIIDEQIIVLREGTILSEDIMSL